MSDAPRTRSGRQLYELLPEVYRNRDRDPSQGAGDLAAYLDACGELLDRVRNTLDQRLADVFPDRSESGEAAQGWIVPYIAQLLDVRLVSPHLEGRREEVAQAISWRQCKGTLATVDAIAEAVGQSEAVVHEGWKRVAVTPRVGLPLEPPRHLPRPLDDGNPLDAALHPGLPRVTPDLRRCVCIPGSHEDRSRRTVDVRSPSWNRGHHHPRRLILFVPPPLGFFTLSAAELIWGERGEHPELVADELRGGVRRIVNPQPRWSGESPLADGRAVTITTRPPIFERSTEIHELDFLDTLTFEPGPGERVELRGVAARMVVVRNPAGGRDGEPLLVARDCLFDKIVAAQAEVRLEYCTVLAGLVANRLLASDCLFSGSVEIAGRDAAAASCVRYSRLPPELLRAAEESEGENPPVSWLRRPETTTVEPAFFDLDLRRPGGVPESPQFGRPGCGVLHPATADALCFGAEDGGEIGAYHRNRHCLGWAAVLDKLEGFLPIGIEAALVPDPRLLGKGEAIPPG